MSDELLVEIRNRVAILTMNRPDVLNALTAEMSNAATEALEEATRNPDVGCVLLTGAGRGFSAGGDVGNMQKGSGEFDDKNKSLEQKIDGLRAGHSFPWLLHHMPKVTIAAVNGACAGAGMGIAMSCDLRVASDKAKFTTAYANVGFGGDYGTTWQLAQLVGLAKAKELFFLPDVFTAEEAARIGLVNRVVPQDKVMEEAMSMAERIAHGPLVSYRYMKANLNMSVTCDFRTMLDREAETHLRCGETADHKEGVNAFMEKRKPAYVGR